MGTALDGFPVPDEMRNNVAIAGRPTSMDSVGATDKMEAREIGFAKQAVLFAMPPDVTEGKKARVVIMLRFPEKSKITLPVRYSTGLEGPEEISIPKGVTSVEFKVQTVDDSLVNLRRNAWVLFVLGPETSAKLVTAIHDDEKAPRLSIDRPTEINEKGKDYRTARILLDRPADVDFPIRIECDPKGWFYGRETIVRKGKTSAPVSIQIPGDGDLTGDFPITMIARGLKNAGDLAPAMKPMMFIDRAKFDLAVKLPSSPLVEGQSAFAMLSIQGRYDKPVTVALHCDHPELVEIEKFVTIPKGRTRMNFTLKAKDGVVSEVDQKVTVTATTPGFSDGVATMTHRETRAIGHVRTMDDVAAEDMVWDPVRKRIYASVRYYPLVEPGNWPTEPAGVLVIDPETLEVTRSVNIFQPGQLIMSKDGQSLFVASGTQAIHRINLSDLSIQESYTAGKSGEGKARYIRDFWPLEHQPGKIVMALWWDDGNNNYQAGFEVRDQAGAVSPAVIAGEYDPGICMIEPSGDPDVLCGITAKVGRKLRVGGDGSLKESEAVPMGYLYWSRSDSSAGRSSFRYDGNGAYCCSNGIVLDESSLQPIRDYGRSPYDSVCPDTQGNRDYFLSAQGAPAILAYDRASSSLLAGTAFFQEDLEYGTPLKNCLIRWGSDGLAFSTKYKLILVNNQRIVPGDPAADLEVELESDTDQASKGKPVALTARVTNHGPNNATGAILNLRCTKSGTIAPVSSSGGTPVFEQQTYSARMPVITAGSTWTTNLNVTISEDCPVKCMAGIVSDASDPDYSNNSAGKTVSVLVDPAERVHSMRMGAVDIAADPDGSRVWLAVPFDLERQLGNMVAAVDPKSGLLVRSLPIPWNPAAGTLAFTSNGRYLLVGSAGGNEVCRFDLNADDGAPERFRLGTLRTLLALHPVDENGTTLLVSGTTSTSDLAAMTALFDEGVMRPQVINQWFRYEPVVPRFSENRVYLFDAFVFAYTIDAAGLVQLYRSPESVMGRGFAVNDKVAVSAGGNVCDLVSGSSLRSLATGAAVTPLFDKGSARFLSADYSRVTAWDPISWSAIASLPVTVTNLSKMIRWGADGLAMMGNTTVSFQTWPEGLAVNAPAMRFATTVKVEAADSDGDGIPDVMEALFGNSPFQPDACPLKVGVIPANGQQTIRLEFARRADMAPPVYSYEWSDNLRSWTKLDHVDEVVISRFTKAGVEMEDIEARIPLDGSASRFVRLAVP